MCVRDAQWEGEVGSEVLRKSEMIRNFAAESSRIFDGMNG